MSDPSPDFSPLVAEIRARVQAARGAVERQVNALVVVTNFEIGRRIVLHEQGGEARAEYGRAVLQTLSEALTTEFGRGFGVENLRLFRKFYLTYPDRLEISQTPSGRSPAAISQTPSGISGPQPSAPAAISKTPSAISDRPRFTLSWSHYVFLIGLKDPDERAFYEVESHHNGWSLAEYVLEFLGLDERPRYTELDLEAAIIDKLEHFLLELGKGFLFEGRQRRFSFDDQHFFVDLVFYNRLLRCFVLRATVEPMARGDVASP